jgi:hypothetical protein
MPDTAPPSVPRFQFSLRWLLVVMTVVAVVFGFSAVFGEGFFANILFALFPTPVVVAIIYARGELRTFAIGSVIPWLYLAHLSDNPVQIETIIWLFVLAGLCGAIAIATRRWIERNGYGGDA